MTVALVAVENTLPKFDKLFSYLVSEGEAPLAGARVRVPFGRSNKLRTGVVFRLEETDDIANLKTIESIVDEEPVLSEELLNLALYLRDICFSTYYDCASAMLPPALFIKDDKQRVKDKTLSMVRLADFGEDAKFSTKQRDVVGLLEEVGTASVKELTYMCGCTSSVVETLFRRGVVEIYKKEVLRGGYADATATENPTDIVLSDEQQKVFAELSFRYDEKEPAAALLFGVTGSGKTLVFIKLIEKCIEQGKTALLLVPEISLTPQMMKRFQGLFGSKVAIIHSSLSLGERLDEWKRLRRGEAVIALGTRSAVFAPVENLGLVIIDEEGEGTYKSENGVRYHARDVAKYRCVQSGAMLLMASATPSVGSFYAAKTGRYSLHTLTKRYGNALLPTTEVVDMKLESDPIAAILSEKLESELQTNLDNKEQSILLINRRGFNASVHCMECGEPVGCPNCSVALTYHRANEHLMCHYCGYMAPYGGECKKCASNKLHAIGQGTQKIEAELKAHYPKANIQRLDADTANSRYAAENTLAAFGRGDIDILIGTQMVAKGLDFPNVTLVGVLSTDVALYTGDYASAERTFSLITQVLGRGGRGDKPARAYIQTYSPEHPIISASATQDYEKFYEGEIASRKALCYPPFCDICYLTTTGTDEAALNEYGHQVINIMRKLSKDGGVAFKVVGRAKAPIYKISGVFRQRIFIKCRLQKPMRDFLRAVLEECYKLKGYGDSDIYAEVER